MKKAVLLFLSLFSVQVAMCDGIYFPELDNLFESDLVVDASYMRVDGPDHFYIQINEVIKGDKYGLNKGNYLKLRKLKSDDCGFPFNHSAYRRNRYYLKKYDDGWRINRNSAQSIQSLHTFSSLGKPADQIKNEGASMNGNIRQFLNCYQWNEEIKSYEALVSQDSLDKLAKKNIMIAVFEQSGRLSFEPPTINKAPEPELEEKEPPIMDCALAPHPATSPFSGEELGEFVNNNANPLSDNGISGKVYVKFLVDSKGNVGQVTVVKGISPVLDSLAVQKVLSMPKWEPAQTADKKKHACTSILPITFKLKDVQPGSSH